MLEMKTKIKAKSILISFRLASLNTNTLLYLNAKYQKYPKVLAKRNLPTFQSTSDNKPIFLFLPSSSNVVALDLRGVVCRVMVRASGWVVFSVSELERL
jgi:hypothetical protein